MLLSLACGHCDQSGHWSRPRVRHCSNPVPARRAAAPAPRRVRMQQRGHEFVGEVVLEFKRGRCSLRPRLHPVPSGEADQEAQPDSDMHECHAGRCEQHGSKLGVRSEANDRRYSEHLAAPFLVGATCDDRVIKSLEVSRVRHSRLTANTLPRRRQTGATGRASARAVRCGSLRSRCPAVECNCCAGNTRP